MQSLEFTLDAAGEEWVRRDWRLLADAGISSHAKRTRGCVLPHMSATVGHDIPLSVRELALEVLPQLLPLKVGVGGILLFGDGPYVLARPIQAPPHLLTVMGDFLRQAHKLYDPIRTEWVPHITLARKIRPAALPTLRDVVQPARETTLTFTGFRYCNPDHDLYQQLYPNTTT